MEWTNNRIPEQVETIHLIAVCGTGMGALACMLQELGYRVTGSDHKVYPPMSDFLREKGVAIMDGFRPENIEHGPDLVVVGNAVSRKNPEVERMLEKGLCFCSMPQALNHFGAAGRKSIMVTGTHGKTTTASLMAWLLHDAGFDPTFLIGGILRNFDSNYRVGKGAYLVVEGDEYDTAFFDKGPKFLHYRPDVAILTSVEFDHADIFRDFGHVQQTFDSYLSRLPSDSLLLAFGDDPAVQKLATGRICRVASYGRRGDSEWRLGTVSIDSPWSIFEVFHQGVLFETFRVRLMGEHNLWNTVAVIAAAHHLGISPENIRKAIEGFESVKRRQEIRGVRRGITVMDDFAHHPTAVRETIRAVKPFYPDGRLIAVFEPRTNSSMRNIFQEEYARSFGEADLVCIREPSLLEKIPPDIRFSARKLVDDLSKTGQAAHYFPDTEGIISYLLAESRSGDVILIMSNGGFDNIHHRLLQQL